MAFKKISDEKLWALIPAYNEEETIKEVVKRTKKVVKNVLVVNDGSTDKTESIIKRIKNIEFLNFFKNLGKANALKKGIQFLRKRKAERVVTIDADLQHLPEEIPLLLNEKADIVIGAREKLNSEMPFIRKVGNFLASKIINLELGIDIKDPQSGFRIYNRKALNKLSFKGEKFNIEKKTLKQACEKKLSIKEVPITCVYNKSLRKSHFTLKDALEFLKS